MDDSQYLIYSISGTEWKVPPYFVQLQPIGSGGYGSVCSATDLRSNSVVAIKKLQRAFSNVLLAKRAYRELKVLRFLKHDNVIELVDIFVSQQATEDHFDIYIVTELMPTNLHDVMRSQVLQLPHIRLIFYLLMRALVYVHSAGLLHRDLKPSNIVVDENVNLKVLDFGLARPSRAHLDKTGYVTTRYFRAPEVFTKPGLYDSAMDIWSAGCILGELVLGRSLFTGDTSSHQMNAICEVVGKPNEAYIATLDSEYAQSYLRSLPDTPGRFSAIFEGTDPEAFDLLRHLLQFDETQRPSAAEILQHPFLAEYHDPDDEPVLGDGQQYDDAYESLDLSVEGWKEHVLSLIRDYQASKMAGLQALAELTEEEMNQVWARAMDEDEDAAAGHLPDLQLTDAQLFGLGFIPPPNASADIPMEHRDLLTPATQLTFLQYEQQLLSQ
eukprot:m.50200 g.50200  ORF g.50200 m.50200 type:complete len:440 (+) comp13401_c0_seq1:196-1515(+)